MSTSNELISAKAATGIKGLDDILAGGLSRGHMFLLEGEPGTGKTTVALHFLLAGARRRAISIIKKRTGSHESIIREYRISAQGMTIGEPLDAFQGVLSGIPTYLGASKPLLEEQSP